MSMASIPAFAFVLVAAGQPGDIMGPDPAVTVMEGPTLICGEAFALRLAAGERARYQEGPDFQIFNVEARTGPFLIYEGNYPQPDGELIRTGRDFPSVIAVHYEAGTDTRTRRRLRERIVTGARQTRLCPQQASAR
jgi:hypothetical protein